MKIFYTQSALCVLIVFSTFSLFAKKILVTGGAGFIGSHVAQYLLQRGDSVVLVDNLNDAYDLSIKKYNISQVKKCDTSNSLRIYIADICDVAEMSAIFNQESPDVICHLAARAGVRASIEDPYEYIRSNVTGTVTMFEMAHKFGIKHVVAASSSSVYGVRSDGPFSEDDVVDYQSSPYGATKRTGELLAYVYHHLYGLSITNLRFFTVYGPRGRIDMAPFIFMDAIYHDQVITVYGDGTAVRDFTYVADIVDGIVKSIDTPSGYQILNIGCGEPVVLADFIHIMENIVGKVAHVYYAPGFAGDVPRTHADISKAKLLLGYNSSTSVYTGLKNMYEWYKDEYLMIAGQKKRAGDIAPHVCCFV
jgi:UDP-glucuronate 4-epimerase